MNTLGSTVKHIPRTSRRLSPRSRYGGSWTSSPMPCPRRWRNHSPWPPSVGGMSRNPRTGSCESSATAWPHVSCSWPLAIAAIWRMRMERLPGSVMSASNSGKCETTVSSRSTRPSAAAKAAAVEVNDLLSEYRRCGRSALNGRHQPSATTCPCRTSMITPEQRGGTVVQRT